MQVFSWENFENDYERVNIDIDIQILGFMTKDAALIFIFRLHHNLLLTNDCNIWWNWKRQNIRL